MVINDKWHLNMQSCFNAHDVWVIFQIFIRNKSKLRGDFSESFQKKFSKPFECTIINLFNMKRYRENRIIFLNWLDQLFRLSQWSVTARLCCISIHKKSTNIVLFKQCWHAAIKLKGMPGFSSFPRTTFPSVGNLIKSGRKKRVIYLIWQKLHFKCNNSPHGKSERSCQ